MQKRLFRGKVRRIHFVGIGGSGMNGIAAVLLHLGFEVQGSDRQENEASLRLKSEGAKVFIGHAAFQIEGADVLVKSTAIGLDNVEVQAALELGIPVIPRAEMLAEIMRLSHGIAVAGSHGKTTTTSLLAAILIEADLDPTVIIGGKLNHLASNAMLGRSDYLVAEADESDGSFLMLSPCIGIATNIDLEHVDHWQGGIEQLKNAFVDFFNRLPFFGLGVICIDSEHAKAILPSLKRRVLSYGFSANADYQLRNYRITNGKSEFDVFKGESFWCRVTLNLLGLHNALNSVAALIVSEELGANKEKVLNALSTFSGVDRRLSLRGENTRLKVFDDYAHHPTEIAATLAAVRAAYPKDHIIVLFQPHRFTRTQAFLNEFASCFKDANCAYIAPVYAAGESEIKGANHESIVSRSHELGFKFVESVDTIEDGVEKICALTEAPSIIITMGAGSVSGYSQKIAKRLL